MDSEESIFDINKILKRIYISLKQLNQNKNLELIFEMHATIPREFKGNGQLIERLLTNILVFVYKYTSKHEIVLVISAPKDFLYEEEVSFSIMETGIAKEKILAFLETDMDNMLSRLEGKIIHDENNMHIDIPMTIAELGFRRHYRLPSKSMLQKKVLLIVESGNVTSSIAKMFKYFPYDVNLGFKEFQNDSMDLSEYDVVVMEDNLITNVFKSKIKEIQKIKKLKFVLLGESGLEGCSNVCACLVKPITQESIFELIISLFNEEVEHKVSDNIEINRPIHDINEKEIMKSNIDTNQNGFQGIVESKRAIPVEVLDINKGLNNTEGMGVLYSDELEKFLEIFEKSDLYFRQIVNEKSENKIKDFCIDLEKQAKVIGAESMLKFADIVSLIFVYDKLDMLPIYPGRYHLELEKLVDKIEKYLGYR